MPQRTLDRYVYTCIVKGICKVRIHEVDVSADIVIALLSSARYPLLCKNC